jgi:class 3 adenylate cyclase
VPETKYAKSGGVHIAYRVLGAGPIDLVVVPGWISHLEALLESPDSGPFIERLASFARVILFDKRGTGLSDRVAESQLPALEQRMDDLRAVMEGAGSTRAALVGISEGGPMSFLFAATYPERTSAVVAYASYARWLRDTDHPWAPTREQHEEVARIYEERWGEPIAIGTFAPSRRNDKAFAQRWARYLRAAASPAAAVALYRMNVEIDVRHVLPAIRVPVLLLHRAGDRVLTVEYSRYLAARIPGARLVELAGDDHSPWVGDRESIVGEIEEFLTGIRHAPDLDRMLATVMFTDIVGSTERAVAEGDARWRDLLASHHRVVRQELARFRGREIDAAGDGFFATFDGPARAIRCACAAVSSVRQLGLEIRAGLHTGECELMGDRVGGIGVHIGARVVGLAAPGEVLVSSTVKDLVAGSGLRFVDRGTHALKGVPGEWRMFRVVHE